MTSAEEPEGKDLRIAYPIRDSSRRRATSRLSNETTLPVLLPRAGPRTGTAPVAAAVPGGEGEEGEDERIAFQILQAGSRASRPNF